jgi:hypothetical protein
MSRFLRRGPFAVALIAWRAWRRLPAAQRRQLVHAARTHGPKLAKSAAKRRRRRP